jgi:acetolactate synthase I/II/III large subunit
MHSAGHLIVDQLKAAGIARVYSVPGESYLDVLDGLFDSKITNVVARHEGGAGFMALAEGRLTGKPGVVLVTRGPGAANAAIAVHTAWQDQTPLVLMIGLIPIADRNRESFQEFDPHAWFGSTAKKVLILHDADSAAQLVDDALYTAASGRRGPVVIGLPEDVLTHLTAAEAVTPREFAQPAPTDSQLASLASLLNRAERPLVVVGGDGWDGPTGRTLATWASAAGIPIAADFRAYDAVPHDSDSYVGSLGYGRSDALAATLDDADLLLFVGCVRGDVLSDGYTIGMRATTVLVNPDVDAHAHTGPIDLQLVSTIAEFVGVLPSVTPHDPDTWLRPARSAHLDFVTPVPHPDAGVDLYEAMSELAKQIDDDVVVTYGAGNHAIWAGRYLAHTSPHSLVAPRNGAMGVGVPAAVAAALVFPGRRILTVAGDGCFMMNGQELATSIGYGAPIVAIVVDNGCFATIREHQEAHYPGRPSGTQLTNPDFASLARSYGLHGETVRETDQFRPALERALKSSTGALLHILTDPATRSPAGT